MIHFNGIKVVLALAVLGLAACDEQAADIAPPATSENIRFLESHDIRVAEPSGLALSADGKSLWTVSDEDGSIHRLDLEGRTLARIETSHSDVEDIAAIGPDKLAFIAERERLIVVTDMEGHTLREAKIPMLGSDNKGPEGLCYDEVSAEFHVLQELPGTLLTLNADLRETARRHVDFAQDYSGIRYDSDRRHFWILSDQSESIYVLNQGLEPIKSFSIDVKQMEGLAIDHRNRRIYVISDPLAELYVFEFDEF